MKHTIFVLIALTILLVAPASVRAQATAQLNGRVTDESGAVLPGVTVTATQTDTGFTRSVVTESEGGYVNNFNWGNPTTNFNAATFGRIQSQAGDPRIMQFGVKYGF
jgi:hypothetical protein